MPSVNQRGGREAVFSLCPELLGDRDKGLELRDEFAKELQRSLAAVEVCRKTVSVQEVVARLRVI